MQTIITFIAIFAICFLGSLIHSSTGFGFAIILMSTLPLFIQFKEAVLITVVLAAIVSIEAVIFLRNHINLKLILVPFIAFFISSTIGVFIITKLNDYVLQRVLGFLLVILAIIFIFIKGRVRIKPTYLNGIIAGIFGGVPGGMFAMGGPPLATYFFFATSDNYEYKSSLDVIFAVTGIYNIALYALYDSFNKEVINYTFIGAVATIISGFLGFRIFQKLNRNALSRLIYVLMFIMGTLLIMKNK